MIWATFDLETHTYYKGNKINSQEELDNLFKDKKEIKDEFFNYFEIKPWVYQVYDEINGFNYFNNVDDLLDYIRNKSISLLWDFNLKFDGTALIYRFFKESKKYKFVYNKRKLADNEISFSFVASLRTYYRFQFRSNFFAFDILDFHNIVASSISKLAKDFKLEEQKGKMDYFKADWNNLTPSDIEYMKNDVVILYKVIKTLNDEIKQMFPECNKSLDNCETFMTAGGMAKTFLLASMFSRFDDNKTQMKRYHDFHPQHNLIKTFQYYKDRDLYRGGITIYNPDYQDKLIHNIYSYDVNSEYPYVMSYACDLIDRPIVTTEEQDNLYPQDKFEKIIIFSSLEIICKENAFPVFSYEGKFKDCHNIDKEFAIFQFEFDQVKNFYDVVDFKIKEFHYYKKGKQVYNDYVRKFYQEKVNSSEKPARKAFMKILLNSAYGKLGQNPEMEQLDFDEEKVKIVSTDKKTVNREFSTMSIINASYITAKARCYLLSKALEIGEGNIRKNVIYMDTDSVYTFKRYKNTSADELGGMKEEHISQDAIFLAPKTYLLIENNRLLIKSKGLNVYDVLQEFGKYNIPDIFVNKLFSYNKFFFVRACRRVKAGILIYKRFKNLANIKLFRKNYDKKDK